MSRIGVVIMLEDTIRIFPAGKNKYKRLNYYFLSKDTNQNIFKIHNEIQTTGMAEKPITEVLFTRHVNGRSDESTKKTKRNEGPLVYGVCPIHQEQLPLITI